ELAPIPADEGQLQQVVLNLMLNALQAMEGHGGTLTLRTRTASDRKLGPCAAIIIEDTGAGINEADQARLFDPFFTRRDGGTGLGLFGSARVVARQRGEIRVKSTPGEGSRFTILLPAAEGHLSSDTAIGEQEQ